MWAIWWQRGQRTHKCKCREASKPLLHTFTFALLQMGNSHNIEHVAKYALSVCNSNDAGGGRLCGHTQSTATIADCGYWPDAYSQAILARFPASTLAFLSAPDTSSSGFIIILSVVNTPALSYVKPSDVVLIALSCLAGAHAAYLLAQH